ncbi:MAG TPA: hypothetical protein VF172_05045 [Nitrososphaera sp.]
MSILVVVIEYYYLALATSATLLPVLFAPAFGQEIEPRATLGNATEDDPQLNATGTELPVLEQMSEKGIYLVQLRWPQVTLNEQGAWQIEMVFLNGSSPRPNATNFPQTETNETGQSTSGASGFTDTPEGANYTGSTLIETTVPIESYDIAIYDQAGNLMWEQIDQPGLGGRGTQRIDLEGNNYTGPVTINITDIRPGWDVGDDGTTAAEDMIDSVSFSATIVPEFPTVAAALACGVAAGIVVARLRQS